MEFGLLVETSALISYKKQSFTALQKTQRFCTNMQFENLGKIPSSFYQCASCAGTFTTIVESVGVGEFFGEFLRLPLSTCIFLEVKNMLGNSSFL